jgi:endonuclease/exonuclease/phosphatase (EEP) superfamily protein YafD
MRRRRLSLAPLVWPPFVLTATFCAAAGLAAQAGRVNLTLDLLAQFAPVWLAGSACALAAAWLFRGRLRWVLAAIALTGVVAAASLVVPEFLRPEGPRAAADAPGQLKIIQFNVWHDNEDPEAVLAWLDAQRPDIVVIEESSPRFIRALAAHGGWQVGCPRCEVMILSRTQPIAVGKPPRHGHLHLGPITRGYFRDGRGVFTVIGVHNAWPSDIADQQAQERRLAETIAETGRERLIVVGDFNSTPWSFSRRRWDEAFGVPRRERAIFSWPARNPWLGLPFLPIDHVYAGPGWATVKVERGPRLSSDHYPLVATFAPVAPR